MGGKPITMTANNGLHFFFSLRVFHAAGWPPTTLQPTTRPVDAHMERANLLLKQASQPAPPRPPGPRHLQWSLGTTPRVVVSCIAGGLRSNIVVPTATYIKATHLQYRYAVRLQYIIVSISCHNYHYKFYRMQQPAATQASG